MHSGVEVGAYSHTARWAIRLALFMGIYTIIAAALLPDRFLTLMAIYADKFLAGIPVLLVGGVSTAALINGRGRPIKYALTLLRERWRVALLVLASFFLSLVAFNAYKLAIPTVVPYYADRWLADLDETLHGVPPWELAHYFDGPVWAKIVFNCYEVLWFFQWFGMILFVALWSDRTAGVRYLWAAALILVVVGTLMATALASVGPIFYFRFLGVHRFIGLKLAMQGFTDIHMVWEPAKFLLNTYRTGSTDLGGGISAMPSLHVAFVTLNAYFLTSLNRRLGIAGWVFAGMIFYGSIYTGWHYAVDGYVAFGVVSIIWWLTGRVILPQRQRLMSRQTNTTVPA